MSTKEFKKLTYNEQVKLLAKSRLTVGRLTQIEDGNFVDYYMIRLAGLNFYSLDNRYKFDTKEEALEQGKKLKEYYKAKMCN